MSPVNFERVREIFLRASKLGADERPKLLDEQCAGDDALRREVESLLEHHDQPGASISSAALEANVGELLDDMAEDSRPTPLPKQLGHYEILGVLGEGGMGAVYRARQQNPERFVALKVIRPGMATPSLLHRFQKEADVLGRLQHPGIAQIFEAGSVDGEHGCQPYFAMELVEGEPLDEFVRARALDLLDRLRLVAQICRAVHHAHMKGVIHRDLKPANILVRDGTPGTSKFATEHPSSVDASPVVKILDFGIARVTDSDVRVTTFETHPGQLIGTLPYMSPEQVSGDPADLDLRTDVYSLGVILYQLLANRLPYDISQKSIPEAARVIRDEEPLRLGSIRRPLRGDVETIVGKALEKERDRRYSSAAALLEDLERYVENQPISARPASTLYQFRKFARRNKALVGGVFATLLLLIVAVIGTTYGLGKAKRALTRSETLNNFLGEILTKSHPDEVGAEVRLLDIADLAMAQVPERFSDDPVQEARVREMLGDMYASQTISDKSLEQYTQAFEILREKLGPDDPEVLRLQANRFSSMSSLEMRAQIEREAPEWVDRMVRVLGPTDPHTIITRREIALTHAFHSRFREAEIELKALLAELRSAGGDPQIEMETTRVLARMLHAQANQTSDPEAKAGFFDEAIRLLKEVVDRNRDALRPDESYPAPIASMLCEMLRLRERYAEAEVVAREFLETTQGRLVANSFYRLQAHLNVGLCQFAQAEANQATADSVLRAVDGILAARGRRNPVTAFWAIESFPVLLEAQRYSEGERYSRLVVEVMSRFAHSEVANSQYEIFHAGFLLRLGRTDEATPILTRLLNLESEISEAMELALLRMFAAELAHSTDRPDVALAHYQRARAVVAGIYDAPRWLDAVVEKSIRRSGLDLRSGEAEQ